MRNAFNCVARTALAWCLCPALSWADVVMPESLRASLSEVDASYSEAGPQRYESAGHLPQGAVERAAKEVHDWVAQELSIHPSHEVFNALESALPVIRSEGSTPWQELRARVERPGAHAITASALVWERVGKEIVAFRIDRAHVFRGRVYRATGLPTLIAKEGGRVTSLDIHEISEAGGEMCVFWGLVAGPTEGSWPDVVVSFGPQGTLGSVDFQQYHVDQDGNAWRRVATADFPELRDVTYDTKLGRFTIYSTSDAPRNVVREYLQLHYGGRAEEVRGGAK